MSVFSLKLEKDTKVILEITDNEIKIKTEPNNDVVTPTNQLNLFHGDFAPANDFWVVSSTTEPHKK